MPSFQLALEQGADAIELDAMLTGDGAVIVMHDNTVERTTNGRGVVKDMDVAALRELDAGGWFDVDFAGTRIPLLSEVLEAFAGRTMINIELKNDAAPFNALPERVAEIVRALNADESVFVSSFNPLALRRFHKAMSTVPLGLLALGGGTRLGRLAAGWVPHDALHPHRQAVTARLMQRARLAGKRVHTYTVNTLEEMQRLFALGVDAIFTDDPALAITIRREYEDARG